MSIYKLITFDLSYTLITPVKSVSEQYAKFFKNTGKSLCYQTIQKCYGESHKLHTNILPIYGLNASLSTKQWWESVFLTTLINSKIITTEGVEFVGDHVKPELIGKIPLLRINRKKPNEILINAFEDLYNNFEWKKISCAADLLSKLNEKKTISKKLVIGAITNNDERIHGILEKNDLQKHLDFVLTSRETGYPKPDRRMFEIALDKASNIINEEVLASDALHIGDGIDSDYFGAVKAGYKALLLDSNQNFPSNVPRCHCISNLMGVLDHVS